MNAKPDRLILTCEHGGNSVPRSLAAAFRPIRGMLSTHRGWDPGALPLARQMAAGLRAPLFAATISRLVVDLNRSEHHPRVFSRITRGLPEHRRERLFEQYYRPFRREVLATVSEAVEAGESVVHVSVHSFTPVLGGERRHADVGFLYDPKRRRERELAAAWGREIRSRLPGLRVRMNYPYKGTSDGHTTRLRSRFAAREYAGVELEINQAFPRAGGAKWSGLRAALIESLAAAMEQKPRSSA